MLKPLFKYAGGKYNECRFFAHLIPETIRNYYEPFAGSAGVYLYLRDKGVITGQTVLSDVSFDLINFYRCVADKTAASHLRLINDGWKQLAEVAAKIYDKFGTDFEAYITDKPNGYTLESIQAYLEELLPQMNMTIAKYADFRVFKMPVFIAKSLFDKAKRFKKKTITSNHETIISDCIYTAIYQGFYFCIRDMYNDFRVNKNHVKYSSEVVAAHWLFLREMCFGSMYRFNPNNGKFNVPYGGKSYNSKTFDEKIKQYTSTEVVDAFAAEKDVHLELMDYKEAIDLLGAPGPDDFIFLDPPYDSTFSAYDGNSFGRDKHTELANKLKTVGCKWMMVIKNTEFIYGLYAGWAKIASFDKTYSYQARGSYDKDVEHLIITNY